MKSKSAWACGSSCGMALVYYNKAHVPSSLSGLFCYRLPFCFGASNLPPEADQRLARRYLQGDRRNQIRLYDRSHHAGGRSDRQAAARRRISGFRYLHRRRDPDQSQPGRALSRHRQAQTDSAAGPHRRCGSKREDWSMDPFVFTEKDGYFYGRGTADDKAQVAVWIANLIRYKREGYKPDRDIIVALTADEEGGGPYNGVDWLIKNHRNLIDAEFALNEGGRGQMVKGKRISNDMQAAEKWYLDLRLEVRNKGGHSSQPVPDNAIYHLAGALVRLSQFGFPLKTNEVTRGLLRGNGEDRYDRHQGRSGQGGGGRSGGHEAHRADVPGLELDAAHHLRRHLARRRARPQCAAATRRGQRELPRSAGRFAAVRARHAEESLRRRSGHGFDHQSGREFAGVAATAGHHARDVASSPTRCGRAWWCCRR